MNHRPWLIKWVFLSFLVLLLGGRLRSELAFFPNSILPGRSVTEHKYQFVQNRNGNRNLALCLPECKDRLIKEVEIFHLQAAAAIWQDRRLVSLMMVFLLLTGYYSLRMYYQRKARAAQLEIAQQLTLEQERLRIARDMHDDLGSGISALMLLAEIARRKAQSQEVVAELEKISKAAAELAIRIRETIWMINSHNDTVHQLIEFIYLYTTELLQDTGILVSVELPTVIDQDKVPGDKRRAVFLVCKEALNNILKHADATSVFLKIQAQDRQLQITIQDDGKGCDPTEAWKKNGYGLKNMRERMYGIGGSFELITSYEGEGTRISLIMPYP